MKELFYNLSFADEIDMMTWCELYNTTKDIFDIMDTDEDGGYHVSFGANDVPKYHKEMCKKARAEEAMNEQRGNGTAKKRTNRKFGSKTKARRSQTANEAFLLR